MMKTVCGDSHPRFLDIRKISHNGGKPYGGKPIVNGNIAL